MNMQTIELDARLQKDSYQLGHINGHVVLLMKNACYPWFVLVPNTAQTEFYKLDINLQYELLDYINQLSEFIMTSFPVQKMNIATIGNIVSQLHIHIVGRRQTDASWPGVVWGAEPFMDYATEDVANITSQLSKAITEFEATLGMA